MARIEGAPDSFGGAVKVVCRFPLGIHFWRWWCTNGLKNKTGGTIGGSFLMRRLRDFYSIFFRENVPDGYIRICDARVLFVDVLDLRTYEMVLPQLARSDTELLLARTLTPPGGVFVDIGANVGVLSLFALSDKVAAVHSFEPNPAMMSRLRMTRDASPFAARWHLHVAAVGASTGRLKLYVDTYFSGTASLRSGWQGSGKQTVDVPVIALDQWSKVEHKGSVDVVKMDVEGWESAVLDGARDVVGTHKPFVWFEHNLPALRSSGLDPHRVLDSLQALGYDVFYDIGRLPDHAPLSSREVNSMVNCRVNLLAVPDERSMDFDARVRPAMRALGGAHSG